MRSSNQKSSLERLESNLFHDKKIAHGFFTRNGGVSTGNFSTLDCNARRLDSNDDVFQNLQLVADDFSVPYENIKLLHQVHSKNTHIVTTSNELTHKLKADALVTNVPNIVIGVYTADCVPILFASEEPNVIGVCHAGWKGAIAGIIQDTLEKMSSWGASNIKACIGPAISQKHYEVDVDYRDNFLQNSQHNDQFFIKSKNPGHFMFDLTGFCYETLANNGVSQIQNIEIDTYSQEKDFFSNRRAYHRKESGFGGQLSAICIKK